MSILSILGLNHALTFFSRVRSTDEFSSLVLLSASSHQSLITLWTASYCSSCRVVAPLIRDAIEKDKIGESEGGVAFAQVEVDAPGMGGLGMEYSVSFYFLGLVGTYCKEATIRLYNITLLLC